VGATWSRVLLPGAVVAVAPGSDRGMLAVLETRSSSLGIVRTLDGGCSWERIQAPPSIPRADVATVTIGALGRHLAIAFGAPGACALVSSDEGQHWELLEATGGAGRLALVQERDEPVLYASVYYESRDRGLVVRVPLWRQHEARVVVDLDELRPHHPFAGVEDDGVQRILALTAAREGEMTVLEAATGIGIVRARLREAASTTRETGDA
jgi:hypothetical protein